MPSSRGLLLTLTEPPSKMEAEFNAWYDTEHIPERNMIPGVIGSRRWRAVTSGAVKYLATYELASADVLQSPNYLRHVGEGFTPWSRRCLEACITFRRWAASQIGGDAVPEAWSKALLVILGRTHISVPDDLPGVVASRLFFDIAGGSAKGKSLEVTHITLIELQSKTVCTGDAWRRFLEAVQQGGESPALYESYAG